MDRMGGGGGNLAIRNRSNWDHKFQFSPKQGFFFEQVWIFSRGSSICEGMVDSKISIQISKNHGVYSTVTHIVRILPVFKSHLCKSLSSRCITWGNKAILEKLTKGYRMTSSGSANWCHLAIVYLFDWRHRSECLSVKSKAMKSSPLLRPFGGLKFCEFSLLKIKIG